MKKTLIGWLLDNKDVAYPGIYKPEGDGWIPCIITYSEDEWEEVEVVRWVVVNTCDKAECFTAHTKKLCEDWMANVREPEKLEIVRLSNTYRRRKPEPEVWKGPTKRSVSGDVAIIQLSSEWIGKRVRVEVIDE